MRFGRVTDVCKTSFILRTLFVNSQRPTDAPVVLSAGSHWSDAFAKLTYQTLSSPSKILPVHFVISGATLTVQFKILNSNKGSNIMCH